MARQLWLLRHAEAEPHGTRADAQRRLTARGRRQARTAGLALTQMGASFELIMFSPKVRAAETAKLAAEGWSDRARSRMAEHAPLAGGFDARQALEASAGTGEDGRLLLVGHEPDLSRIVGEITGGRIDMKKGGVAAVRLEAGGGELVALLRPRELALIAGVPVRGH
jgi:phosphohistidine phosphatase